MTQFPGTGLTDPPDDNRDPEIALARRARRHGITRKEYVRLRSDAIRLTGRVLKWDSATYDQAYAALSMIVEEVWGTLQ